MIVGLFTPTAGDIIVNGSNILTHPVEAKQSIGYVPDIPFLYEKLTGREFLYFIGGLFRIPKLFCMTVLMNSSAILKSAVGLINGRKTIRRE